MDEQPATTTLSVQEVMTKDVIAIDVSDTLDVIAGLFEKYDYEGIPVIDAQHTFRGLISKHDMILQSSEMHLPTVLKLMDQIARGKGDERALDSHFGRLRDIKASSMMDINAPTIRGGAPFEDAAKIFADYPHVSTLCVVDDQKKLLGLVSHSDVIKFFNQVYLKRVVQSKSGQQEHLLAQYPTKTESDVDKAFGDVQNEFLLVQKSRPLLWKYVSIGMFAAGLMVASALIIKFVAKGG